jgi:hypothetical protein
MHGRDYGSMMKMKVIIEIRISHNAKQMKSIFRNLLSFYT